MEFCIGLLIGFLVGYAWAEMQWEEIYKKEKEKQRKKDYERANP